MRSSYSAAGRAWCFAAGLNERCAVRCWASGEELCAEANAALWRGQNLNGIAGRGLFGHHGTGAMLALAHRVAVTSLKTHGGRSPGSGQTGSGGIPGGWTRPERPFINARIRRSGGGPFGHCRAANVSVHGARTAAGIIGDEHINRGRSGNWPPYRDLRMKHRRCWRRARGR